MPDMERQRLRSDTLQGHHLRRPMAYPDGLRTPSARPGRPCILVPYLSLSPWI
jgi:hypothetical protein